MRTIDLIYIDANYTINFSLNTYLDVLPNGTYNNEAFKRLILNSVGEFGRGLELPEAFFVMKDSHLDEFLINIATKLYTILFNFYVAVPSMSASTLVSNSTSTFYKVKGYNQHHIAVEALEPKIKNTQEVVWGAHEHLLREFSYL